MTPPDDRKYAESHEWHKLDGDVLTLGITAFAVDQLTDLTFVEMKAPGTEIEAGDAVGEVESVKTTSDIYSGVAGEVIEANEALESHPGLVNEDPYGAGWLVKIRVSDPAAMDSLMDSATYVREHAG